MMFNNTRKKTTTYLLSISLLLLTPALLSWNSKTQLQAIIESGALKLVTRNSPKTYFIDKKGEPAGFEYDLAKAYAEHLGIQLELIKPEQFNAIFTTMEQRNGHLAGAMLTATEERKQNFVFSNPYLTTSTSLIYRDTQGQKPPKNLEDLISKNKKLLVLANSSHSELLAKLKQTHPGLTWQETTELSSVELLEMVQTKEIDYTLYDSIVFDAQQSFFPGLNKAFDLGQQQTLAWMLKPHSDQSLLNSVNNFLKLTQTQALIAELKTKYFQRSNSLDFYDTAAFKKHMQTRFPKLEQYFFIAEQETGIDWQLLASIAYQESHWNPKAVSPTGVRGIMMLTQNAAKEVGVSDRTDPVQSIIGGAHYLQKVMAKIPERITQPDHTWFALAGYNVGYGHLEDARVLTSRAGLNPDKWNDVKKHLPLLTQEKYFSTVRYGYARGHEPVQYVGNIQKYIKLLQWEIQVRQAKQKSEKAEETEDWQSAILKEETLSNQ